MFDFVINPAGASGHTGEVWKQTEEILKAGDVSYRVHFSSRETGVEEIVRELTSSGEDISLVIVGGDGTMNQAVNGIADFSRTKVGFIPCGSGNDLARSLGLSDDIKRNVETILRNTVIRNLDVGEAKLFGCTGYPQGETVVRRFNNGAGIGFDAQVCEEADISKAKDFLNKLKLGKLVYITTALKTIFNAPRIEAEITTDGEVKKFNALLMASVMNEPYQGGGFKFAPDAEPTDALTDICIVNNVSRSDFFRIFPSAYNGNHIRYNGVYIYRAARVSVKLAKPMWVQTDGEVVGMTSHMEVTVLPRTLNMLV